MPTGSDYEIHWIGVKGIQDWVNWFFVAYLSIEHDLCKSCWVKPIS